MAEGPIQVVLNTDAFKIIKTRPPGGHNKDFYAGHDDLFASHKQRLLDQVYGAMAGLTARGASPVGVAKVILRSDGIAKSHRPIQSLFRLDRTPILGGINFGQLLFQITPSSLAEIAKTIEAAEPATKWEENPKTGKVEAKPTRRRSEVGVVDRIELYGASDKRTFSANQAIEWLQDSRTGGAYHVDLFQRIIPRERWDQLEENDLSLQRSFIDGIEALDLHLRVYPIGRIENPRTTLSIRLVPAGAASSILFQSPIKSSTTGATNISSEIERDAKLHDRLLGFLDRHPLVRSVRLPAKLKSADKPAPNKGALITIPDRIEGVTYPRIGIIDGGAANVLSKWIIGAWDLIATSHKDFEHSTFIGGLVVAGELLNGLDVVVEPGACDIVDISIVPRDDQPHLFFEYFRNGMTDFLDEVEAGALRKEMDEVRCRASQRRKQRTTAVTHWGGSRPARRRCLSRCGCFLRIGCEAWRKGCIGRFRNTRSNPQGPPPVRFGTRLSHDLIPCNNKINHHENQPITGILIRRKHFQRRFDNSMVFICPIAQEFGRFVSSQRLLCPGGTPRNPAHHLLLCSPCLAMPPDPTRSGPQPRREGPRLMAADRPHMGSPASPFVDGSQANGANQGTHAELELLNQFDAVRVQHDLRTAPRRGNDSSVRVH